MKRIALLCPGVLLALGQSFTSQVQPQASFKEGCGPADPAYIRTANETGGIPMFLQRSEAAKAFHLVSESTRNNVSTVLWAAGSLERQAQVFEVPVDSLTQRMTFTFSFDTEGNNVTIVAPSRGTITQNSRDTDDELSAGSAKQAEFTIRNTGYDRTFKLTVTDARKFVSKVEPTELMLGPGQSGTIRVGLTVPPGTSQGVGDDVIVAATSTAGPATANSTVAHFSVTAPVANPNR